MTKNESLRVWIFRSKLKFFCKKKLQKIKYSFMSKCNKCFLDVFNSLWYFVWAVFLKPSTALSQNNYLRLILRLRLLEAKISILYRFQKFFDDFFCTTTNEHFKCQNLLLLCCTISLEMFFFFEFFSFYCNLLLRSCFVVVKVLC